MRWLYKVSGDSNENNVSEGVFEVNMKVFLKKITTKMMNQMEIKLLTMVKNRPRPLQSSSGMSKSFYRKK